MLAAEPSASRHNIVRDRANLVTYSMFRRSLLKQCQTAHSAFLIRARLAPSSPSRGPSFLQTFPQSLSSLPPRLCRRYASTEPSKEDPDKGASALAQEDGGKETPADAEESLRQELETKKKEIIDLKVWIHFLSAGRSPARGVYEGYISRSIFHFQEQLAHSAVPISNRINISGLWPIFVTSKNEHVGTLRLLEHSLSSVLQQI